MILFDVDKEYECNIYQYDENEFFQWEKDRKQAEIDGIYLHSYKQYGMPVYFLIVDFSNINFCTFHNKFKKEAN
jgi:hypothetical protein